MKKKVFQLLLLGLFMLSSSSIYAQLKVSGVVKSPTGEVLPGATIVVKGTNTGALAGPDGKYTITVPNAQATLVVSFVGMGNQEVVVNGRSVVDIVMAQGAIAMDEVVVTALGITKEKKSLAYSVGEVKSDEMVRAGNTNVMKSLDGKISGVNLTSLSSDPTSSVLVNIRGTTAMPTTDQTDPNRTNVSVKGQPLYVIDGIPVGAQTFTQKNGVDFGNILSQLSPEDIENVTVLKGGSAGALYGSDGGNGVVMITTKTGRGGKKGIGVSFSTAATWDQPYQFIEEQQLFGQGERAYEYEYDNTDTWGPTLDGSYSADFWNVKTQKWDNGPMTSSKENRIKTYLQTGTTVTTNININGNYDKGAFRLSFNNMGNTGVMPNTKTNQKSVTLNSEYKLTNKVKVSANISYVRTYSPNKANVVGSNSILNTFLFNFPTALQPLSDMTNYWIDKPNGLMNGAMMKDNGIDVELENPWWSTYEKINIFTRDNFFGKVQLDWQLSKDFSLMVRSGLDNVVENYEYRQSFGKTALSDRPGSGDGQFTTNNATNLLVNSDAILTYNKTFGKFNVTANAGANYAFANSNSYNTKASALVIPELFTMANAFPGKLTADYLWSTSPSYSVYGTADVGWNNQLFFGATGRNDWKGNLPEEKINYFYPSFSAAWVVSETFHLPEVIDLLKARLGWADVGNGLVKSRSIDTYTFESPDWSSTVKTANINAILVDPDIKPMHSITKEIGADLWLLKRRVMFDFTYFVKDQNDQLGGIPLVQGTGFTSMTTNIGDVRSKGYEWGLTLTPVRTQDWTWDISASFTHYKAHISRLSPKFAPNGYVFAGYDGKTVVKIAEGEEIGNIYEQNPILRVKSGQYKGLPLLNGETGEFQISSDETERGQLGNYNPDYILGLNTTVRYKALSLNLVGSYRKGGKYVSVNQQYLESNGRANTTLSSGADNPYWSGGRTPELGGYAWPADGSSQYEAININNHEQRSDNFNDASYAKGVFLNPDYTGDPAEATDADYIVNGADPVNTFYQYPYNSYGDVIWDFTSTRTYDATNFKMREISLTYTLPNAISGKINVNNVNISLIARNVFQWNKSGRNEDPESAFSGVGVNQGILRATLPSIRSMGFKLSFDF
jgi:TonB-linked SusC/RagA family outer membrane protein